MPDQHTRTQISQSMLNAHAITQCSREFHAQMLAPSPWMHLHENVLHTANIEEIRNARVAWRMLRTRTSRKTRITEATTTRPAYEMILKRISAAPPRRHVARRCCDGGVHSPHSNHKCNWDFRVAFREARVRVTRVRPRNAHHSNNCAFWRTERRRACLRPKAKNESATCVERMLCRAVRSINGVFVTRGEREIV